MKRTITTIILAFGVTWAWAQNINANKYLATDSVDFSIQGITDNKVDSVVLTSLLIGMVQRNSVWQHQRRRKVMECQGNFVFLPCPEMVMGVFHLFLNPRCVKNMLKSDTRT